MEVPVASAIETQQAAWLESQGAGAGGARFLMDDRMIVSFSIEPRLDQAASDKAKRPIFNDCEYVEIRTPGNTTNIVKRPVTDMDRSRFREKYAKWRESGDNVTEGTPLAAWPAITVSQRKELEFFGIKTVQQLAELDDNAMQNFRGAHALKGKAKEFLEAIEGNRVKELEDQVAEMQQQMADLAPKKNAPVSNRKRAA